MKGNNIDMDKTEIDYEKENVALIPHFGEEMRNHLIIDGFFQTIQIIYDAVEEDKKCPIHTNDLIYPFLHSIRHYYELELKFIIYEIHEFYVTYKKGVIKFDEQTLEKIEYHHDIGELYYFIKDNFYLLDERCKSLKYIIDAIYDCIEDFLPEGDIDQYRYATDKQGNEFMPDINIVSYDKKYNAAVKFESNVRSIHNFINHISEEYKLETYHKNISRHQILDIAKKLPEYNRWKENSFKEIKEQIAAEYNLSKKDLSGIIDIIKNSRWLSYYIKFNRPNFDNKFELLKKCMASNIEIEGVPSDEMIKWKRGTINIYKIEEINKEESEFVETLSLDEKIEIFTYYRMGHELCLSENYSTIFNEVKKLMTEQEENETNYFRSKLYSRGFIDNVMAGVYSCGDYELFIKLLDYLHNETKVDCTYYDQTLNQL